jgi:hypothetical protein
MLPYLEWQAGQKRFARTDCGCLLGVNVEKWWLIKCPADMGFDSSLLFFSLVRGWLKPSSRP